MTIHSATRQEQPTGVVVAIPTYRRPEPLKKLLASLSAGVVGVSDLRIIVLDNEPSEGVSTLVAEFARTAQLPLEYVQSPIPGIAAVRNHALQIAESSRFLVFVDDDETVSPGWLAELLRAGENYGADVVVGPVHPQFEGPLPRWLNPELFAFDQPLLESGSSMRWCATNNTAIGSRARALVPEGFSESFSATGGSDSLYFFTASTRGAKIIWTNDAAVNEIQPEERLRLQWMLKRAYRGGTVRTRIELQILDRRLRRRLTLAFRMMKGFAAVAHGAGLIGFALAKRDRSALVKGMLRAAGGAGTIAAFFGLYGIEYKRIEGKP